MPIAYKDRSSATKGTHDRRRRGRVSAACELFVMFDLLRRGLEVTRPVNPCALHDLHARFKAGWKGIQVKAGVVNLRTNRVTKTSVGVCRTSPVLAIVHLPTNQIRYEAG